MKVCRNAAQTPKKRITLTPDEWRRVADDIEYLCKREANRMRRGNYGGCGDANAARLENDAVCVVGGLYYIAVSCADEIPFIEK